MQTITQRKKLSKGTWVLIFVVIAAIIALTVLAAIGYIDLSPYANGYVTLVMWGSSNIWNALIITGAPFILGMLVCWALYRWFIGQKVTVANQNQIYTPQTGASPTTTTQGTSTEVS